MKFRNQSKASLYFYCLIKFIFVLSVLSSCKTVPHKPEFPDYNPEFYKGFSKRKISGKSNYEFYIQPYQNVTISINEEKFTYRIINIDKNIAKINMEIPNFSDPYGFVISLQSKELPIKRKIIFQKENLQGNLIAIDQAEQNNHKFFASWKSGREPKSVRFLDSRRVAVAIMDEEGFDVIDILSGKTSRQNTPPEFNPSKKGFVESLIIKELNEIWMSQMKTATIHSFDLNDFHFKGIIQLSGQWSKVMTFDPFRNLVYCSNWFSKDISIINIKTKMETEKTPKLNGVPRGMVLWSNGENLYFAQFSDGGEEGGGRVGIFSLKEKRITDLVGSPGSKRHIINAIQPDQIYVSDMQSAKVELFDMKEKKLLSSIPVFHKPNTIVLSPDKKYLYVSCRGPNHPKTYLIKGLVLGKIYVIDTSTNQVVESWEAGNQPTGLDISPDGKYLVTSDFLDHRIRVYQRTNN